MTTPADPSPLTRRQFKALAFVVVKHAGVVYHDTEGREKLIAAKTDAIARARTVGALVPDIAKAIGVTRQRVTQITKEPESIEKSPIPATVDAALRDVVAACRTLTKHNTVERAKLVKSRSAAIANARAAGLTWATMAEKLDISIERVRQLEHPDRYSYGRNTRRETPKIVSLP